MTAIRSTFRLLAFWVVVASIVVVISERVFWFWTASVASHIELAAFYALPVGVAMVVIGRFKVDLGWSLLLVAPFVAFIVEGVLTPVIYTGPFLPIFPAWFAWWHGIMAFVIGVVVVRSWLLAERMGPLTLFSVGFGCFWGLWSSTLWLPENVEDPELLVEHSELVVREPGAFAIYVAAFTAVFIVSHLALGLLWPERFEPSPTTERVVGGLVAIGVIGWSIAVPWALPMFVLYLFAPWRTLGRHRAAGEGDPLGPPVDAGDLFGQLHGLVRPRAVLPLFLIVPAAATTYWALWAADPSDAVLRVIMYGTIAVQGCAAGVIIVAAVIKVRRRRPRPAESRAPLRRRWPLAARDAAGSR